MFNSKKKLKVKKAEREVKKPRDRFVGGLPDGTVTNSIAKYAAAWREFAQPFMDEFGWLPYGYEPGISFWVGINSGAVSEHGVSPASTFHMNLSLARRFRVLILEVQALRKALPRRTICQG